MSWRTSLSVCILPPELKDFNQVESGNLLTVGRVTIFCQLKASSREDDIRSYLFRSDAQNGQKVSRGRSFTGRQRKNVFHSQNIESTRKHIMFETPSPQVKYSLERMTRRTAVFACCNALSPQVL